MEAARSRASITAGIISTILLLHFWAVLLAPQGWGWQYPGGFRAALVALALCVALSFLGGRLGARWCYWITTAAILTFVYFGLFLPRADVVLSAESTQPGLLDAEEAEKA